MFQPGIDRQLSQVRYNEFLQEAAEARLQRRQTPVDSGAVIAKMGVVLILVGWAAPIIAWVASGLMGH